jgi:predicted MFS family arabinose efflux permease
VQPTTVYIERRRKLLGLIVLGLAASAASAFLPQAPGILGDLSRILFGLAAGSAFVAASVLAVLLAQKDEPEAVLDPAPPSETAPVS